MVSDDRASGSWPGVSLLDVAIRAMTKAVHDLDVEVESAIQRFKSDVPPEPPESDDSPPDHDHDDEPPPASPPPAALAA